MIEYTELRLNLEGAFREISEKYWQQISSKGDHNSNSLHEILGVMFEEFQEFADEVKKNDQQRAKEELIDIAVAAIWGIITINEDM